MKINSNLGRIDRVARLLVGVAFIYLGFVNTDLITNEVIRYVMGGFGVINVISSIMGFCPLYSVANIDTRSKETDD